MLPFFTLCHSSCIIVPLALSFLSHCCFTHVAILTFQFSCYNCALLFSHYNPSPVATPFALILFSHYCFRLAISLMASFPSHYFSHTIAHFKYLLTQPLLFFLCCHCYSFHVTTMLCLVNMVLPLPLPCVSQSLELWHQLEHQR